MRKLKLDVSELQVESFDIVREGRKGTVRGLETFVGDTDCGTCNPNSFGGTCQIFGCDTGGQCTYTCETSWEGTCHETCITCATMNCGWGCTQYDDTCQCSGVCEL